MFSKHRSAKQLGIAMAIAVGVAICLWPTPAYAMHITEGILPMSWAGIWFLVAVPFVFWGMQTINHRRSTEPFYLHVVALVGSAIFVISCMPVPVPWVGTCSHPCGTGLGAVLIGPGPTVLVASIALVFQALFLSHGGLTTLGANIVSMGIVGAFSAYCLFRILRTANVPIFVAAFLAGMISDWATYATTSLELSSALHGDGSMWTMFLAVATAFVPTQLPLGIAEGFLTAIAYQFILARRPDVLGFRSLPPTITGESACETS
jgi:cobalt/nickel transport system permease protein